MQNRSSPDGMAPRPQPERKGKGCFFWGCGGFLAIVALIAGIAGYLFYTVRGLTSETPVPIEVKEVKPGEYESVKKEIERFERAAKENRPADLVLTADDLNTLIAVDPGLKEIRGSAFVKIEDDQILLDLSLPLDRLDLPVPGFEGRYLNGTFTMRMEIVDGKAALTPVSAVVKGEPVPESILEQIRKRDLLSQVRDERFLEAVKKAKSLRVEGGKVIVER